MYKSHERSSESSSKERDIQTSYSSRGHSSDSSSPEHSFELSRDSNASRDKRRSNSSEIIIKERVSSVSKGRTARYHDALSKYDNDAVRKTDKMPSSKSNYSAQSSALKSANYQSMKHKEVRDSISPTRSHIERNVINEEFCETIHDISDDELRMKLESGCRDEKLLESTDRNIFSESSKNISEKNVHKDFEKNQRKLGNANISAANIKSHDSQSSDRFSGNESHRFETNSQKEEIYSEKNEFDNLDRLICENLDSSDFIIKEEEETAFDEHGNEIKVLIQTRRKNDGTEITSRRVAKATKIVQNENDIDEILVGNPEHEVISRKVQYREEDGENIKIITEIRRRPDGIEYETRNVLKTTKIYDHDESGDIEYCENDEVVNWEETKEFDEDGYIIKQIKEIRRKSDGTEYMTKKVYKIHSRDESIVPSPDDEIIDSKEVEEPQQDGSVLRIIIEKRRTKTGEEYTHKRMYKSRRLTLTEINISEGIPSMSNADEIIDKKIKEELNNDGSKVKVVTEVRKRSDGSTYTFDYILRNLISKKNDISDIPVMNKDISENINAQEDDEIIKENIQEEILEDGSIIRTVNQRRRTTDNVEYMRHQKIKIPKLPEPEITVGSLNDEIIEENIDENVLENGTRCRSITERRRSSTTGVQYTLRRLSKIYQPYSEFGYGTDQVIDEKITEEETADGVIIKTIIKRYQKSNGDVYTTHDVQKSYINPIKVSITGDDVGELIDQSFHESETDDGFVVKNIIETRRKLDGTHYTVERTEKVLKASIDVKSAKKRDSINLETPEDTIVKYEEHIEPSDDGTVIKTVTELHRRLDGTEYTKKATIKSTNILVPERETSYVIITDDSPNSEDHTSLLPSLDDEILYTRNKKDYDRDGNEINLLVETRRNKTTGEKYNLTKRIHTTDVVLTEHGEKVISKTLDSPKHFANKSLGETITQNDKQNVSRTTVKNNGKITDSKSLSTSRRTTQLKTELESNEKIKEKKEMHKSEYNTKSKAILRQTNSTASKVDEKRSPTKPKQLDDKKINRNNSAEISSKDTNKSTVTKSKQPVSRSPTPKKGASPPKDNVKRNYESQRSSKAEHSTEDKTQTAASRALEIRNKLNKRTSPAKDISATGKTSTKKMNSVHEKNITDRKSPSRYTNGTSQRNLKHLTLNNKEPIVTLPQTPMVEDAKFSDSPPGSPFIEDVSSVPSLPHQTCHRPSLVREPSENYAKIDASLYSRTNDEILENLRKVNSSDELKMTKKYDDSTDEEIEKYEFYDKTSFKEHTESNDRYKQRTEVKEPLCVRKYVHPLYDEDGNEIPNKRNNANILDDNDSVLNSAHLVKSVMESNQTTTKTSNDIESKEACLSERVELNIKSANDFPNEKKTTSYPERRIREDSPKLKESSVKSKVASISKSLSVEERNPTVQKRAICNRKLNFESQNEEEIRTQEYFSEVEEIDSLEILEKMLISAESYDERRIIRSRIRVLKKTDSNYKGSPVIERKRFESPCSDQRTANMKKQSEPAASYARSSSRSPKREYSPRRHHDEVISTNVKNVSQISEHHRSIETSEISETSYRNSKESEETSDYSSARRRKSPEADSTSQSKNKTRSDVTNVSRYNEDKEMTETLHSISNETVNNQEKRNLRESPARQTPKSTNRVATRKISTEKVENTSNRKISAGKTPQSKSPRVSPQKDVEIKSRKTSVEKSSKSESRKISNTSESDNISRKSSYGRMNGKESPGLRASPAKDSRISTRSSPEKDKEPKLRKISRDRVTPEKTYGSPVNTNRVKSDSPTVRKTSGDMSQKLATENKVKERQTNRENRSVTSSKFTDRNKDYRLTEKKSPRDVVSSNSVKSKPETKPKQSVRRSTSRQSAEEKVTKEEQETTKSSTKVRNEQTFRKTSTEKRYDTSHSAINIRSPNKTPSLSRDKIEPNDKSTPYASRHSPSKSTIKTVSARSTRSRDSKVQNTENKSSSKTTNGEPYIEPLRHQKTSKTPSRHLTDDDKIISPYGIGPTDENGVPLIGLRALKRKPQDRKDDSPVRAESSDEKPGSSLFGLRSLKSDTEEEEIINTKTATTELSMRREDDTFVEMEHQHTDSGHEDELDTKQSKNFKDIIKLHESKVVEPMSPSESTRIKPRKVLRDSFEPANESQQSPVNPTWNVQSDLAVRSQKIDNIIAKHEKITTQIEQANDSASARSYSESSESQDELNEEKSATSDSASSDEDYQDKQVKKGESQASEKSDYHSDYSEKYREESQSAIDGDFRLVQEGRDGQARNFLNDRSKVTGFNDALTRMAGNVERTETANENDQAKSLLNKFLGAQIIMSGVESMMDGTNQSRSSRLAREQEEQRSFQETRQSRTEQNFTKSTEQSFANRGESFESSNIVRGINLNQVTDDNALNQLLNSCEEYEERRKVRARLKALSAEKKELQKQLNGLERIPDSYLKNGRATNGSSRFEDSSYVEKKNVSPFQKFKQLEFANQQKSQRE